MLKSYNLSDHFETVLKAVSAVVAWIMFKVAHYLMHASKATQQ